MEGHAEMVSRELCAAFGCAENVEQASREFLHQHGAIATLAALPGHSGDSSTLRYVEGRRYMERLSALPDGDRLVLDRLRQPPRDVVTLFSPDPRVDSAREAANQRLQQALSSFELPLKSGSWIQLDEPPVDASDIPFDQVQRERFVSERLRVVEGAAQVVFFEHSGYYLRPVEMRITRVVSGDEALRYAENSARAFRLGSASLVGSDVSMRNVQGTELRFTDEYNTVKGSEHSLRAELHHLGQRFGTLNFTAIASGEYVLEMLSRVSEGEHRVTVEAGRTWLAAMAKS
ncbi:MAG: hypothetical protein AAF499_14865 [Pseudomonadota bacterium]